MEVITRKIGTVRTKKKSFFSNAFINVAGLGHVNGLDGSIFIAASPTDCLFWGNIQPLGDGHSYFFVTPGQINRAVKTIQAAGCGHFLVIHFTSFPS
jgi:hypothetical protein